MLRIDSVENILYEDAKRRQISKLQPKTIQNFESPVNSNSEKLLIEKLYKEFFEICEANTINYSDFEKILKKMHFIMSLEKNKDKENGLVRSL